MTTAVRSVESHIISPTQQYIHMICSWSEQPCDPRPTEGEGGCDVRVSHPQRASWEGGRAARDGSGSAASEGNGGGGPSRCAQAGARCDGGGRRGGRARARASGGPKITRSTPKSQIFGPKKSDKSQIFFLKKKSDFLKLLAK